MASPRSSLIFQYSLSVKKSELDKLRYGRRPDNTLAPKPIFNTWTIDSIKKRVMDFYTSDEESKQLLMPISVGEDEDFFHIIGKLRSTVYLGEEGEHKKFIQNNDYHVGDGKLHLKSCWWQLPPATLGLFLIVPKLSVSKKLNHIFNAVVTLDNTWKYSAKNQTAWFKHDSVELLQQIANFFKKIGVSDRDILISSVEGTKQPIILIQNFEIEKLAQAEDFKVEAGKKDAAMTETFGLRQRF